MSNGKNQGQIITRATFAESPSIFWQRNSVLVGGCFDILHYGHFTFLKNARGAGDFLSLALESDEFIKERKQKNPVHTQIQRAEILASLRIVDQVILLEAGMTDGGYARLVDMVKPAILAVTAGDAESAHKEKYATQVGASFQVVTPLIKKFSSSKIRTYGPHLDS